MTEEPGSNSFRESAFLGLAALFILASGVFLLLYFVVPKNFPEATNSVITKSIEPLK